MPFPFTYICDLLQSVDDELQSSRKEKTPSKVIIANWFQSHRSHLNSPDNDASAVLSALLPERRTDRVYGIQATRLHSIIGRALGLGHSRVLELRRHMNPGAGVDLGDCVEGILIRTPNPTQPKDLAIEEIDAVLHEIAAGCRFSSPTVRAGRRDLGEKYAQRSLGGIYVRLSARDAKWFTRLILKSYQPVVLDEYTVFSSYHVLLPQLLKVRDDLTITTAFLRHVNQSNDGDHDRIATILRPELGTKIGRQPWFKGRSIKNCLDMAMGRDISVEQKIDGEYCQIHIDLSKGSNCIQIFSKSGKDSTNDRTDLHSAIRDSLRLGKSECPIRQGCILEGELVVYSSKENKILPFHKIRKHVSRSGSFLGTSKDSQPHEYEHLMIIYYDVLMVDDESLLSNCQSERRRRLENIITCRKGHAEIVQANVISCSRRTAAAELRELFATCITNRVEGIVLKPDTPYFDFSTRRQPYACCNIKLKKEYIQGWGDVGDFAVVGAGYDAAKAKTYKTPNLKWTHFYIGCLQNRNQVRVGNELARFVVINVVEINEALMKTFLSHCYPETTPFEEQDIFQLELHGVASTKPPTVIFTDPIIFDVRCFSFDKEPNSNGWSMRFPMVSKIHFDRSYIDAITYEEVQEAAKEATEMPEQEDSQEMRHWISALEKADPRGRAVDASSQWSTSSESTGPSSTDGIRGDGSEGNEAADEGSRVAGTTSALPSYACGPALLTPASSTLGRDLDGGQPLEATNIEIERPKSTKRRYGLEDSRDSKKRSPYRSAEVVPQSTKNTAQAIARARQPLEQINQNVLTPERHLRDTNSATSPESSASKMGYSNARALEDALASSPHSSNVDLTAPLANQAGPAVPQSNRSPRHAEAAVQHEDNVMLCTNLGENCVFANKTFLLSPCIANYAWVTENLLRAHGITNFIVDPTLWSRDDHPDAPSPASDYSASAAHRTSSLGERPGRARKICLVESRRKEATEAFLKKIEEANLQMKDGSREWVAVYDWKILERVTELESQRRGAADYDPWRQYHVGLA